MGKAVIKGPLGGGEYLVDIKLDSGFIDSQVTFIPNKIAAFELKRAAVKAELDDLLLFHPEEREKIAELKARLLMIGMQIAQLNIIYRRYSEIDTSIEARMWCADYTLDLAIGLEVGTADIPNQRQLQNIMPGYDGNAAYSGSRDGISRPALASGPANLYYNWAILPGWQRHKPLYRYGTITEIDFDNDLCSLDVEPAVSTEQAINVNIWHSLSEVPIVYMDCNADAFQVGDRVLINFEAQDWTSPKVIGFASNPKECRQIWEPFNVDDGIQALHEWELYYHWFSPGAGGDICPTTRPENNYYYVVRNDITSISGNVLETGDDSYISKPVYYVINSEWQSAPRDETQECIDCVGDPDRQVIEQKEIMGLMWAASDDDPPVDLSVTPWIHLKMTIGHEWESVTYQGLRRLSIGLNCSGYEIPREEEFGLKDYPGPHLDGGALFWLIMEEGYECLKYNAPQFFPLPGIKRYDPINSRWLAYDPRINWVPDYTVEWTGGGWNTNKCYELQMEWPQYAGRFETVFDARNYPLSSPLSLITFSWYASTACQRITLFVDTIDFYPELPERFDRTWFN